MSACPASVLLARVLLACAGPPCRCAAWLPRRELRGVGARCTNRSRAAWPATSGAMMTSSVAGRARAATRTTPPPSAEMKVRSRGHGWSRQGAAGPCRSRAPPLFCLLPAACSAGPSLCCVLCAKFTCFGPFAPWRLCAVPCLCAVRVALCAARYTLTEGRGARAIPPHRPLDHIAMPWPQRSHGRPRRWRGWPANHRPRWWHSSGQSRQRCSRCCSRSCRPAPLRSRWCSGDPLHSKRKAPSTFRTRMLLRLRSWAERVLAGQVVWAAAWPGGGRGCAGRAEPRGCDGRADGGLGPWDGPGREPDRAGGIRQH